MPNSHRAELTSSGGWLHGWDGEGEMQVAPPTPEQAEKLGYDAPPC